MVVLVKNLKTNRYSIGITDWEVNYNRKIPEVIFRSMEDIKEKAALRPFWNPGEGKGYLIFFDSIKQKEKFLEYSRTFYFEKLNENNRIEDIIISALNKMRKDCSDDDINISDNVGSFYVLDKYGNLNNFFHDGYMKEVKEHGLVLTENRLDKDYGRGYLQFLRDNDIDSNKPNKIIKRLIKNISKLDLVVGDSIIREIIIK